VTRRIKLKLGGSKMSKTVWRMDFVGTCCDTGRFEKTYNCDTEFEAHEFYEEWEKAMAEDGGGFSDGWEHLSKPYEVKI